VTQLIRARVQKRLVKLLLGQIATRLDSLLVRAATVSSSDLDFLDALLAEETEARQLKRTAMGLLGTLTKADADNVLGARLCHFCKPKLLIIDELGYLPFV
jgi:hypothetical protein